MNSIKYSITHYLFGLLLIVLATTPYAGESSYNANEVETAFLYRSLQYVKWDKIVDDLESPIVICSNAPPPLSELFMSLEGRPVQSRIIKVEITPGFTNSSKCNAVFITAKSIKEYLKYLNIFSNKQVLTISDNPNFSRAGGVLNLILKNQRIIIEVNIEAAERNNINFSAKFLRIAKIIKGSTSKP